MATNTFEPLRTQTLREQISTTLKDAILEGALKEGEKLVERRLADQFGASLTSVREALIELELQGFVTKKRARRNATTYVTKLSWNDLAKIFMVRRVVEKLAVEEAAALATQANIQQITDAYLGMVEAAHQRDLRSFDANDVAFHQGIWESTDNPYLQRSLEHLLLPYFAFTGIRTPLRRAVDLIKEANAHSCILKAIEARDVEAARSAFETSVARWYATAKFELS